MFIATARCGTTALLALRAMPRAAAPIACMSSTFDPVYERRLLLGVFGQELEAHERTREALLEQLAKAEIPAAAGAPVESAAVSAEDIAKAHAKALRRAQKVPARLAEVEAKQVQIRELMEEVRTRGTDLAGVRATAIEALGLGARLDTFDIDAASRKQVGRPDGFDGLVLESPRGVPILVARQSFKDSLLRRIGRGNDLFFQVQEHRGSRVLLRTSMRRDLARSPRECMEMAADLAAFFSDWRYAGPGEAEVMFTDARHVAKRGTRVGQLKRSKSLGTLWASPSRVADVAREAQETQGWL